MRTLISTLLYSWIRRWAATTGAIRLARRRDFLLPSVGAAVLAVKHDDSAPIGRSPVSSVGRVRRLAPKLYPDPDPSPMTRSKVPSGLIPAKLLGLRRMALGFRRPESGPARLARHLLESLHLEPPPRALGRSAARTFAARPPPMPLRPVGGFDQTPGGELVEDRVQRTRPHANSPADVTLYLLHGAVAMPGLPANAMNTRPARSSVRAPPSVPSSVHLLTLLCCTNAVYHGIHIDR